MEVKFTNERRLYSQARGILFGNLIGVRLKEGDRLIEGRLIEV